MVGVGGGYRFRCCGCVVRGEDALAVVGGGVDDAAEHRRLTALPAVAPSLLPHGLRHLRLLLRVQQVHASTRKLHGPPERLRSALVVQGRLCG